MLLMVKILFVILLMVGMALFFGKFRKKPAVFVVGLCALTLIASLISGKITDLLPRPTDNITLTATGEKNENALSSEVSIKCLKLEGNDIVLDNAIEGKWFWKGDCYMWRPETDDRQPEGVTRSVTLSLPVGIDRALVFDNNAYRGIVVITYNGTTTEYDLYSENSKDFKVKIPTSNSALVYGYKALNILVFIALVCALMAFPCFAVLKKPENIIRAWFARNWDRLVYAATATIVFCILFNEGKNGSFWYDEVWNIGWAYDESRPILSLYDFAFNLTFDIMPYGQEYLLIMPELFTVLGIYVMGLIGSEFRGKRLGVIMAIVTASSSTILSQCGMEFRYYANSFMAMSLVFYMFLRKQKHIGSECVPELMIYGVILAVSMDSHQFAFVTTGFLMAFDLLLIIIKKSKPIALTEFIFPVIYGIYWVFMRLKEYIHQASNFTWPPKPTISGVYEYIYVLTGNNIVTFILFIFGFVYISLKLIKCAVNRKFDFYRDYTYLISIFTPVLLFAACIFYSTVINPNNPLFVNRYFIPVIHFVIFIIAIGIDTVIEYISSAGAERKISDASTVCTVFVAFSLCLTTWFSDWRTDTKHQKFKQAAEYLMNQNDIYCDDTLLLQKGVNYSFLGFRYYITENGKRDDINRACSGDIQFDMMEYDTIYYLYIHHSSTINDEKLREIINRNYTIAYSNDDLKIIKYVKKTELDL